MPLPPPHPHHVPLVADREVTDALRRHGSFRGAARELQVSHATVASIIAKQPHLWPEGVPAAPRGCSPRVTLERMREALRAHGGNMAAAARDLGITRQSLRGRVLDHPEAWPEGVGNPPRARGRSSARRGR